MKKSIILEMFFLNIGYHEQIIFYSDFQYKSKQVYKLIDNFISTLKPKQFKYFNKIINYLDEKNAEECNTHYLDGFKLGVMLGIQAAELKEWK